MCLLTLAFNSDPNSPLDQYYTSGSQCGQEEPGETNLGMVKVATHYEAAFFRSQVFSFGE
jgi:hypothetical protein